MTRQLVLAAAVLLFGCGETVGEQTLQVKAAGLWLTANPLDAPPGALAVADNAVIRRPGIVEPRRGQEPDSQIGIGDAVTEMAAFEGKIIIHSVEETLYVRNSAGDVDTLGTGIYPPSGHPMRFAEAGGGLYLTTNEGPLRLDSPTAAPVAAGVPPGLEGSGTTTGSSGWLANGRVVGYRYVWGARDADGALMLGAPSGRILVTNSSGGSRDVSLVSPIPDGVVADTHFLQVYRTVIDVASGDDPGEDMAQVLEVFPTTAQIAAGTMTVTDIASFANGATAYFSPSSGAGLADSKQQPPLLTDAIAFKGYLFGVVQEYRQTINLALIAVGGTAGLNVGQGLLFLQNGTLIFSVAANASEDFTLGNFQLFSGGTAAQNIENTARSLVRVLNNYAPSIVYAEYVSSPDDIPGKILITSREVGADPIEVRAFGNPGAWTPALGSRLFVTTISRTGTTVTATITPTTAAASLRVGQVITMTTVDPLPADPDFPLGDKTITAVNTGTGEFTYTESGAAVSGTKDVYVFETTYDTTLMDQEAVPGSWAHSAFQEPDAWPPRFRYQIGGPNTRLDRITAQGEALLFWTSDGLYRLTGNDENDFTVRPVDPTIQLVGASTPANMGNKAFALTTQGVVSVTDLGVEKVSTPIDQALLPYYAGTPEVRAITDVDAFGIAYQSENEYYLFIQPLDAVEGDPANQAYVFNAQTGTWTRQYWEWADINPDTYFVTAGVVNPTDNYLYLGQATWITRERKDRALTDYQDADGAGILFDVAYNVETAKNPGTLKQWTEVACLLEAPQPSAVELYFTTEIATVEEGGTISSQGNKAVRTYIPRNKSRSARLTVGLRHDTAGEKPTILGLSVVYNTTSTRVGR